MPRITLPDGSVKEFASPVTARQVAEAIGPRLAQAALGCKVDGELRDLSTVLDHDAKLSIITPQTRDKQADPDALMLIRHSAAHVMAEAIQRIVPEAQLVYGPPLATGFYYDIKFPDNRPLKDGDFAAIEAEMKKIIAEDRPFRAESPSTDAALARLLVEGNKYKLDNALKALGFGFAWKSGEGLILDDTDGQSRGYASEASLFGHRSFESASELAKHMLAGYRHNDQARLSFYYTGEPQAGVWNDLCRGPHVPSTGRIGAVKVMSLASSYWHGDENSDRLTRVYGTAFATQAELDAHLNQLDEARKRDHRVIGKQLRLFHIDEMVGQGLILWTPNGSIVRKELQNFIGSELRKQGYTEVFTPHIGSLDLYKTSGHFPYYKESQFPPIVEREALDTLGETCSCAEIMRRVEGVSQHLASGINERTGAQTIAPDRILPDEKLINGFMLKPMNCPHHARIFASSPHSYRDMPARLAEFGTVYRWEQSGELNGMTRVRGFTQDDAHLFCTEDQVPAEIQGCLSLVKTIFNVLGMKDYRVRVGLRDPDSGKYTGTKESWDKAEAACLSAAESLGVPFSKEPGEAAFYGPKIDFVVKDVIGREWQLGTVQVDYNMAIRFDLSYIGPDNKPHRPVVIHRAPFGSMERFCGVLIEHFAGSFPTWLAPEQVRVLPISEKTAEYAHTVTAALRAAGVRVTLDETNERIQAKIKDAADWKVPYMVVVGPRDAEASQVSLRARGHMKDLGTMSLTGFVEAIKDEIATRGGTTVVSRFV
jgi:threonyl-tRNA synthetase